MNELDFLRKHINIDTKSEEIFLEWTDSLGVDKCLEIYKNYVAATNKEKIDFKYLLAFYNYDIKLSEILFTLLRHSENHIKGFLCNTFNNYPVQIEVRPSNYSKTKYYFKIPTRANKYLDIRTFSYEEGPVDYYDAIKTLDFGDINLIMSHLPNNITQKFSNNIDIISDLDKTRKLRNYVYHHNLLFSMGGYELTNAIVLVLKNLPNVFLKNLYIKDIERLENELNKEYSIKFTASNKEIIFQN